MMRLRRIFLSLAILSTLPSIAFASEGAGHADPMSAVLVALIVILAVAKLGGELVERLGMPAVLGELLGGVVLGNLILLNPQWSFFEPLRIAPLQADWAVIISGLAQLGVIILLFDVGLEATVQGTYRTFYRGRARGKREGWRGNGRNQVRDRDRRRIAGSKPAISVRPERQFADCPDPRGQSQGADAVIGTGGGAAGDTSSVRRSGIRSVRDGVRLTAGRKRRRQAAGGV